jgi:hypothetical protein
VPPPPQQVTAAIDAIREDAKMWYDMAETVNTARRAAEGLGLGESQLSWASNDTGLLASYHAIHQKILTLLSEADANLQSQGLALNSAANGYERDEQNTLHQMRNIY